MANFFRNMLAAKARPKQISPIDNALAKVARALQKEDSGKLAAAVTEILTLEPDNAIGWMQTVAANIGVHGEQVDKKALSRTTLALSKLVEKKKCPPSFLALVTLKANEMGALTSGKSAGFLMSALRAAPEDALVKEILPGMHL